MYDIEIYVLGIIVLIFFFTGGLSSCKRIERKRKDSNCDESDNLV